ncbi:MAG TPA: hypothetical protein VNH46_11215, partial [Gemmatimonadales bacterium]|nr:hypothetical protein [Gemmatimonadales bacterium]
TLFTPGGYRDPRTFKADVQITHTVSGLHLQVLAGYHHTDFLPRVTDLNLAAAPSGTTQEGRAVYGTLVQQGGLLVAMPGSNRRLPGYDLVSAIASTGFSNYYQAGFGLSRETARGLSFSAEYLWSRTRDNWLQSWNGDPADLLSPFPQDRPGHEWVEGISDFDVPHRVTVLATWRAGGKTPVSVGARYRFRSGFPFTPGFPAGVDANGDGSSANDPAFVDPSIPGITPLLNTHPCLRDQTGRFAARNSCREAGNHALDVNLTLGLPFHSLGGRLELRLDVFNLATTATGVVDRALVLVDPAGSVTTDSQGNITLPLVANPDFGKLLARRTPPRIVRFGLQLAY